MCKVIKSILNPICRYLQTLPRTRVLSTCSRHRTRVDFSIGHGCPCCINILSFFWERDISFEVRKWLDSLPLMWKLHSPSHNLMTVLGMRWFAHNSVCFSRKKASTWDIQYPASHQFRVLGTARGQHPSRCPQLYPSNNTSWGPHRGGFGFSGWPFLHESLEL